MQKKIAVLLIGESWFTHTIESKGMDSFTFDGYDVGTKWIKRALNTEEITFTHMPCHKVGEDFPETLSALKEYDVVILSDIGANTFLLPVKTFLQAEASCNKLELLKEFVSDGGALCMVGGYLTYQGFQGKGNYKGSAIEDILPINMVPGDDRVEIPQGMYLKVNSSLHRILHDIPSKWPMLLGYNKLIAKENAEVIVSYNNDPIITVGTYNNGRVIAFATDCSPHWSSLEFCDWEYYDLLWQNMIKWLTKLL